MTFAFLVRSQLNFIKAVYIINSLGSVWRHWLPYRLYCNSQNDQYFCEYQVESFQLSTSMVMWKAHSTVHIILLLCRSFGKRHLPFVPSKTKSIYFFCTKHIYHNACIDANIRRHINIVLRKFELSYSLKKETKLGFKCFT